MSSIYIIAIVASGLVFLLVLFKLLKKGMKFAAKLPTNFLVTFLIFGLLGLFGFASKDAIAGQPFMIGILLLIVSLTVGTVYTNKLYDKWEWSISAGFGKKLLYLSGIALTAIVAFSFIFLLCEHRGFRWGNLKKDLVWWLSALILMTLLPLIIKLLHTLWNDIPKINQVIPVFRLPVGSSPPFIETGGPSINFMFFIPLDYHSKEFVKSKVALPYNKTLEEAFHYKLHEHNIIKRYANKIVIAEENKKAKVYGWSFFRSIPIWWGWFRKREYLNPKANLGATVIKGETVFVERVKIWEQ